MLLRRNMILHAETFRKSQNRAGDLTHLKRPHPPMPKPLLWEQYRANAPMLQRLTHCPLHDLHNAVAVIELKPET